jgi:hypothetical protein
MRELKKPNFVKNKKQVKTTTFLAIMLIASTLLLSSSVTSISISGNSLNLNKNSTLNTNPLKQEIVDRSPNTETNMIAGSHAPRDIWDIQLQFDVYGAAGVLGNVGAAWDGTNLYSCVWSSSDIHRFDADGTFDETFTISGVSALRDLAYDGTYFYGGSAGGTIWEMDFDSETLISTITGSFQSRALAYNDDLDVFYASNWGDPVWIVNRDGSIAGQFNLVTATSTYGFAYDNVCPGGPYLWVFDQAAGGVDVAIIKQWDIAAGAFTGVEHDVAADIGYGSAGGMFFATDYAPGTATLGCLDQGGLATTPDIMIMYELCETETPDIHDVGIKSINNPNSGGAGSNLPVQVTVKNYGNYTETSVPVFMSIHKQAGVTNILDEGFEGSFPPSGWSNTGTSPFIQVTDAMVGSYCAKAYYSGYGYWADLTTASFDGSLGGLTLGFWHKQLVWAGDQDTLTVSVSNDGGSTWTQVAYYPTSLDWTYETIDLDSFITPTANMMLKFYATEDYGYGVYLDAISIDSIPPGGILEFSGTEYITSLPVGGEATVEFDDWTPSDWQVTGNADINYDLHAETQYVDENPSNDAMDKMITLSYPYLHDIAVISVDSPTEDGDAQTLPVGCTIKNVGQFDECCYQTKMEIGEVMGSFIDEDFSGGVPPAGWSTTHPSNWGSSNTNYAGGTAPEARFSWTPSSTDNFRLYTGPMDTTGYTTMNLKFKEYVNDYNGVYTLGVETSTDGVTWTTIYSRAGGPYGPTTTVIPIDSSQGMGSSTLQVSFTFFGYSYNINYWYIDDVELKAPTIVEEYEDLVCTIELAPGEQAELTFDDWTPDALAIGLSGPRNYMAIGSQMLPSDTNPSNDMALSEFTLDYRHDVGIQEITEPSLGRDPDVFYAFNSYPGDESVWFDSATPGVLNTIGANTAPDFMPAGTWADGTWYASCYAGGLYTVDPTTGTMTLIGGTTLFNGIAYDGATMYGATSTALYTVDLGTGAATLVGNLGSAGLMIDIAIDQDTGICYGHDIVDDAIYTIDLGTGAATYLGSTGILCNYAQGMEYDQDNDVLYLAAYTSQGELYTCDVSTGLCTLVGAFQGGAEITALAIPYTGGGPGPIPIKVWVPIGTYPVAAIVENLGTFEETGLTCYADIIEFITNPNGTQVYNDSVGNIDLDPLGDEATITFDSCDFNMEGTWGLFMELPLVIDDKQSNNAKSVGIGVDDTPPTSVHSLSPANPDGLNGWYVSDVTVTVEADDGEDINGWQSGVDVIKYKIGSGAVQTITGDHGSFKIEDDGEGIQVEYWSIDNVGNEENPHHTFTVDMDQTSPSIVLDYEVTGGGIIEGWEFTFTATATDDTSGMERVEFYFNNVLQETVPGSGPTYVWVIQYNPLPNAVFKAVGYDFAGNDAYDEIENPDPHSNSQGNSNPMTHLLNLKVR